MDFLRQSSLGDHKSFEILFSHYYPPLGSYLLKVIHDKNVVEDILQETFLNLWLNKENMANIVSFKDYLFISTKNRVINSLKEKAKRSALFCSMDQNADIHQIKDTSDTDLYKEQMFLLLEHEIDNLPDQQREVFKLAKIHRLSYLQIAEQLRISVETVRKHMYLAQKTLRSHVKNKDHEIIFIIIAAIFI